MADINVTLAEIGALYVGLTEDMPVSDAPPTVIPDLNITVPDVGTGELGGEITAIPLDSLVGVGPGSEGAFDKIMSSMSMYLTKEFRDGRITGAEYSKVFIAMIQSAMEQANVFVQSQATLPWQARLLRAQAQNATLESARLKADVETAKLQALVAFWNKENLRFQAATAAANFATAKMSLATAFQGIENAEKQALLIDAQIALSNAQQAVQTKQLDVLDANISTAAAQELVYAQQVKSYRVDAYQKIFSSLTNTWAAAKGMDTTVDFPIFLGDNHTAMDDVLAELRQQAAL